MSEPAKVEKTEPAAKKPRKILKRLIRLAVLCLLFLVLLRWFEHNQVYHPDRRVYATGAELGRPFEDVYFQSSDGVKLNGWYFPAGTNSARTNLAVLICHGNAGNIGSRLDLCGQFLSTGVNVFLFDYRGYGRSEGRPGEEGTYRDGQAACAWLRDRGFSGTNIIVFGESLGGGIATELALREKVGGLILQSTFTSVTDLGVELFPWLPVRWLGTIKYDTHSKLPRINIPVLVMHSRQDDLIGVGHGERNFAVANHPKLFWEISGGHNGNGNDPRQFMAGIEKFFEMLQGGGAAVPSKNIP